MNNRTFFHQCYLQTGGWIPMTPMLSRLELGDFGQVNRQRVNLLGNVFSLHLVEDIDIAEDIHLNHDNWKISSGVQRSLSEREQVVDDSMDGGQSIVEWQKQVLKFDDSGSFFFHGHNPIARMVLNWSRFKNDVTLKLSQADFSFREVMVVTEVATLDNWTLAISGAANAEMQLSAQTSSNDLFALLGEQSCRAEHSRDIATFERHIEPLCYFFKGKKLALRDHKKEHFIRQTLEQRERFGEDSVANWLNTNMLNRVESNELNIATCLEFFDWVDLTLDDVEKLC